MEITTGKTLQCVVVTPEKAVLDETVQFVALPMFDGELGVLPGRAPLIGRLGMGELRTQQGSVVKRFYIDGGFAQIRADVVTVLTPKAQKAENIDSTAATHALEAAKGPTTTPEAQEAQRKAQERARAQLRIAHKVHEGGHATASH
jgi:F-type H+-transporting ATPase subunit epsilon